MTADRRITSADLDQPSRIRRATAADADDRRTVAVFAAALVLLVIAAAAAGLAVRLFLFASGLGAN